VEEKATGIVLRVRPLTETSLIVHWLTRDLGRLSTVAKGARRHKSPFRGKLDVFFEAEFSFARSRRSDLHTLREVSLRDPHAALRRDLGWLEQASYATVLVEQTTETETPLAEIYELFSGFLNHLTNTAPSTNTVFAFEMKLLAELGLAPDLGSARLNLGTKQLLEKLAELNWDALARLRPGTSQITEIRQYLHGFLIHHLGRLPPKRPVEGDG
jgi:DNA repair protein RecO (recombination protein O)